MSSTKLKRVICRSTHNICQIYGTWLLATSAKFLKLLLFFFCLLFLLFRDTHCFFFFLAFLLISCLLFSNFLEILLNKCDDKSIIIEWILLNNFIVKLFKINSLNIVLDIRCLDRINDTRSTILINKSLCNPRTPNTTSTTDKLVNRVEWISITKILCSNDTIQWNICTIRNACIRYNISKRPIIHKLCHKRIVNGIREITIDTNTACKKNTEFIWYIHVCSKDLSNINLMSNRCTINCKLCLLGKFNNMLACIDLKSFNLNFWFVFIQSIFRLHTFKLAWERCIFLAARKPVNLLLPNRKILFIRIADILARTKTFIKLLKKFTKIFSDKLSRIVCSNQSRTQKTMSSLCSKSFVIDTVANHKLLFCFPNDIIVLILDSLFFNFIHLTISNVYCTKFRNKCIWTWCDSLQKFHCHTTNIVRTKIWCIRKECRNIWSISNFLGHQIVVNMLDNICSVSATNKRITCNLVDDMVQCLRCFAIQMRQNKLAFKIANLATNMNLVRININVLDRTILDFKILKNPRRTHFGKCCRRQHGNFRKTFTDEFHILSGNCTHLVQTNSRLI